MYSYSKISLDRLATCHPSLQALFLEVIKHMNVKILWGWRNKEQQDEVYDHGLSSFKFPNGKHNFLYMDTPCSLAVDFVPWHDEPPFIRWKEKEMFYHVAGRILGISDMMGIQVTWGGNWDRDMELRDQKLYDLGHIELNYTRPELIALIEETRL